MGRLRFAAVVMAGFLLSAPALAEQADGALRWRLSIQDRTATLFSAEAEATDFYGAISFRCDLGRDTIDAAIRLVGEDEQKAFARVIADDLYPAVRFRSRPKEWTLIERVVFSEVAGWEFFFSMSEASEPMDAFARTGSFHIEIGTVYATGIDLTAGLDAISAFRRPCREAPLGLRP